MIINETKPLSADREVKYWHRATDKVNKHSHRVCNRLIWEGILLPDYIVPGILYLNRCEIETEHNEN